MGFAEAELFPARRLPWFQRLEMMEEEEEGELPAFQQFGTKVLAVMKPPPEEEQPRDRVSPEEQKGFRLPESRDLHPQKGRGSFTAPGEVGPPGEIPARP